MFTTRKASILILVVAFAIVLLTGYNQGAYGWATEYDRVTIHEGHWYCGSYCGSKTIVSTFVVRNTHFYLYHVGTPEPGHEDGHDSYIVSDELLVKRVTRNDITCDGSKCYHA